MTKYLMLLAALMLMVACGDDTNKTPVDEQPIPDETAVNDEEPDDEQPDETVDTEQPDIDTAPVWVTDQTYAGLEWSTLSEKTMSWQKAMDYCEARGARLPTITELRKIIINCPSSAYGGACKASDPDCLHYDDCWTYEDCCGCDGSAASYSALGDGKDLRLWSSSPIAGNDHGAWDVQFDNGSVVGVQNWTNGHARCVR